MDTSVKKGISEHKKVEKDFLRKENIYLSLMSLQDYAANMSHAVRESLGKIKDKAEMFKLNYPNAELEDVFKLYAIEIYDEMSALKKVVDYMLSYAGSNVIFENLDVKKMIDALFAEYQLRLNNENIKTQIEIQNNFIIHANRQFFVDIFQNLIDNSIKALKNTTDRMIKCSGYVENDTFILSFSDNGIGIPDENRDKVFDLYYTTTAEEGGAGLGLFIVKTRIEALKGTVKVVDNEFEPSGATIRIILPFKNMDNSNLNIVVIDDKLKETDPLLVQLKLNFKEAKISLKTNAKEGLEFILTNLNSKMIVLLDYDLGANEPNGIALFTKIREKNIFTICYYHYRKTYCRHFP